MKTSSSRRMFLKQSVSFGAAAALSAGLPLETMAANAVGSKPGSKMRYGLVTYLWGAKWDLPTLIGNLEAASSESHALGVELRSTHAHGVEPSLSKQERKAVKKRFDDSPVTLVGLGSDERFDSPDPATLKASIEATKAFIKCSHDVGGSGVKVKPNSFHKGVDHRKTIEQIGKALREVGAFAKNYGQQIRLEMHGACSPPTTMRAIMDIATEGCSKPEDSNVFICWNSNAPDLQGKGLEYHFNLLKDFLGATVHVRTLETPSYPFQKLIDLFVGIDYAGWILLEAGGQGGIKELTAQRELFEQMVAKAQSR